VPIVRDGDGRWVAVTKHVSVKAPAAGV